MSITDELRKWGYGFCGSSYEVVNAIADRIDATHEEAMQREHEVGYAEGCGAGLATVALGAPEWIAQHEGEMAEHGWVRLPKDADGKHIHVGDRLDGYGKTIEVVELRHGRSGWVLISRDGNGYADTFAFTHHEPTVEDVLTEFGIDWEHESDCEDRAALLKEYAKRLTLIEGEDA